MDTCDVFSSSTTPSQDTGALTKLGVLFFRVPQGACVSGWSKIVPQSHDVHVIHQVQVSITAGLELVVCVCQLVGVDLDPCLDRWHDSVVRAQWPEHECGCVVFHQVGSGGVSCNRWPFLQSSYSSALRKVFLVISNRNPAGASPPAWMCRSSVPDWMQCSPADFLSMFGSQTWSLIRYRIEIFMKVVNLRTCVSVKTCWRHTEEPGCSAEDIIVLAPRCRV